MTQGRPPVAVVGVQGGEVFGSDARRALAMSDVLVSTTRHLEDLERSGVLDSGTRAGTVIDIAGPLGQVVEAIEGERAAGRRVTVVASGDPGFFGIVRALAEAVGADALVVHPAPTSIALAFARIGQTWEDALVASAHGRPFAASEQQVLAAPKAAVLTAPDQRPEQIGARLLALGCGPREVVVASDLGSSTEAVVHTDLAGLATGSFPPLSVVVLVDPARPPADSPSIVAGGRGRAPSEPPAGPTTRSAATTGLGWALPEDDFEHRRGLITKAEVRAVVLARLALPGAGVLWDVGGGSGSVGIECARMSPGLRVIIIERDPDAGAHIRANAERHCVSVDVVTDSAPGVFDDLPRPDRVFVGGGGIQVLHDAHHALEPGGCTVATHVMVETAVEAWKLLGNMVQISASRAVDIASGFRLDAMNPVFVSWGPART